MADTRAATGLTVQQWDDQFFSEYFQENRFKSEMGTSENSVIQVKEDLTGKKGSAVTFALLSRLTGDGVTGIQRLVGNEEALGSRSYPLTVALRRHAVVVPEQEQQYSAIDLRNAGRSALMDWAQEDTRDRIIQAMMSINDVAYASASEGQKDAWLADNADRVLFGAAKSNNSGNDHSASLANVDSSTDVLTAGALSLMKRMALTASPKIRPIRSEQSGRRFYVCYVTPLQMRDLKADTTIINAQKDVSLRMQNEKLFMGGDVEWDGIIVKEIDDIPVISGVGASSIDVAPAFFCGAQALGYGIVSRWKSIQSKEDDYGDKPGIGIKEFGNFAKLRFGSGADDTDDPKDHGLVTGYFANVADA
tara:strand:- start:24833 stop:25921 length:1089 start_codon:yes stop_codon:yes gene_type:complete